MPETNPIAAPTGGSTQRTTHDTVPVPDPTTLTNELVSRAVFSLREILETRLNANDKALNELAGTTAERVSTAVVQVRELYTETFKRVEGRIDALADVSDQRFLRIDAGLTERDKRADQLALANSAALAAALAAQKEAAGEAQKSAALAISKSETATSESIKQGQTLFQTGLNSLILQVNDLKSRLDKGEGSRTISDPATSAALSDLSTKLSMLTSISDNRSGVNTQKIDASNSTWALIAAMAAIALVAVDLLGVFHK
jgi:hypothetical protein